jgi:hypothetical protein
VAGRGTAPGPCSCASTSRPTGDDDGVRTHGRTLDLGADDVDAEVVRVRGLGAELLWPGDSFVALRDPVGLPVCVTANHPGRRAD